MLTHACASDEDLGLGRGAIVSFPHTALAYAGPLQARVVAALYRSGVERVIALGVLHSLHSTAYRNALDVALANGARCSAFAEVAGGWLPPGDAIETPYGDLPAVAASEDVRVPVRVDHSGVLADEFSLDTFCALLRRAADLQGVRALSVLRVFVGPTRDPIDGSFAVAERLAGWIRTRVGEAGRSAAIVTTGDLVHYGTAYGTPDADPSEPLAEMTCRFRHRVEQALEAALIERDWAAAYRQSSDVLHNDQREILAVVSTFLGPTRARIEQFGLSDYAAILGATAPCRVASALVVYEREDAEIDGRRPGATD